MPERRGHLSWLAMLVLLAALIRFGTLDVQSYWLDEGVTVHLVGTDLWDMLSRIPESESTPPLYYVLAWAWAKLFGTGEVALRSLSALLGTALVPVAYAVSARLASQRAALMVAALTAVNPLLFHYSQEARAYALLALLGGLSLFFFAQALQEPRPRTLAWWALASALALATHYFAAFLIAAEAAWLLATVPRRRDVLIAIAPLAAVGAALVPLALHQQGTGNADWIGDVPLLRRAGQVPKQFLVGLEAPAEIALTVVGLALTGLGLWLLVRRRERPAPRGALIAMTIGAAQLGAALILALLGVDVLVPRNLLAAWLPLAVAIAAGFAAQGSARLGIVATASLCALSGAVVAFVVADARYQRDDWRGAARALGRADGDRAIVVTPPNGRVPLTVYVPGARALPSEGAAVSEIDLVGMAERAPGEAPRPPRPPVLRPPAPGFELVERHEAELYTVARYRARGALEVNPRALAGSGLSPGPAEVLLERARQGRGGRASR